MQPPPLLPPLDVPHIQARHRYMYLSKMQDRVSFFFVRQTRVFTLFVCAISPHSGSADLSKERERTTCLTPVPPKKVLFPVVESSLKWRSIPFGLADRCKMAYALFCPKSLRLDGLSTAVDGSDPFLASCAWRIKRRRRKKEMDCRAKGGGARKMWTIRKILTVCVVEM